VPGDLRLSGIFWRLDRNRRCSKAAQSTLANFVAGLSLIFYRPFSLGDRREIALEMAENYVQAEDVVGCPVVLLNASSVDFSLRVWCPDRSIV